MSWDIEYLDRFEEWWSELDEGEQDSVAASVGLLEEHGANLRFPHSSGVAASRFPAMRELRIQHQGRPYRVLYIFDPRRTAILLLGGDKTGSDRWYDINVPVADRLYQEHLEHLKR